MSNARETTLILFIMYLCPLKLKSYEGHNSHIVRFGRDFYQVKKKHLKQKGQLVLCSFV